MENYTPPGFVRCQTCGEFNGKTRRRYLSRNPYAIDDSLDKPEDEISVTCRCSGPLCRYCGLHRVHRPVSNVYCEKENRVSHVPYFAGLAPCDFCAAQNRGPRRSDYSSAISLERAMEIVKKARRKRLRPLR
jgi:hypothetical protein